MDSREYLSNARCRDGQASDGQASVGGMRKDRSLVCEAVCTVLLALTAFLLGTTHGWAEKYALLIGVSGYEHPKITKLKGPPNDIAALWSLLKEKGFKSQNIRV